MMASPESSQLVFSVAAFYQPFFIHSECNQDHAENPTGVDLLGQNTCLCFLAEERENPNRRIWCEFFKKLNFISQQMRARSTDACAYQTHTRLFS